jgi:ATP-dependent RNA helicase DeaD
LGGESVGMQEVKLKSGVHVLVATPGRLIDLIYSRIIDLTSVKTLVLDEADEMLSMGFYDDLEFIIQCLVQEHQTLLFSATMPAAIRRIAEQHMHQPQEVTLTAAQSSPRHLDHRFVYCQARERDQKLVELLQELQPEQGLIFSHSRQHCETLCHLMQRHFDKVDYLHAGLSQEVRSAITNKFRQGKIRYLVATDVAARGLDFSRITHVFIYQLAPDPEVYIHRAGRAGRCERIGTCITLITERELHTLHKVLALLRREATWIGEPPPLKGARKHPRVASQPRRPRPPREPRTK